MPWTPKDAQRHTKKAKTPKKQRQWAHVADSVLERGGSEGSAIRQANGVIARYAKGGLAGMVKPPTRMTQPPVLGHVNSPLGQAIQNKGNAGRYAGGMGLAPARPPRIPIQSMMRNIDASQKKFQLKALGGRIHGFDQGGEVTPPPDGNQVHQVVLTALKHLQGMDASTAAAVLRSSPEAMSHPEIAAVARALTTSSGITPATKTLNQISQAGSESPVQQTQTLRPPAGVPPQMPGGVPPGGPAQPQPSAPMGGGPAQGTPGPSQFPSTNRGPSGPVG